MEKVSKLSKMQNCQNVNVQIVHKYPQNSGRLRNMHADISSQNSGGLRNRGSHEVVYCILDWNLQRKYPPKWKGILVYFWLNLPANHPIKIETNFNPGVIVTKPVETLLTINCLLLGFKRPALDHFVFPFS